MPVRAVRFTLTDRPISALERSALAGDLEVLGVDERLLDVYSATVSCGSELTRPAFLRAELEGRLLGLSVVFVCRDSGVSFFSDPRLRRIVRGLPPIWYWERASLGTDGHAGPGLVTSGIHRETYSAAAISWLSRHFVMGALIDEADSDCLAPCQRWPGVGASTLAATPDTRGRLLVEHRNLARKVRKFAARGGTLERLSGPLAEALACELMVGYNQNRPINPPFREMYLSMVTRQWAIPGSALHHVVARIDGQAIGYHTFLRTGQRLVLLSGVFDRHESGNVHAYENVLLESISLAVDTGCTVVDYGGTVNDVKASLLTTTPTEVRFVTRIPPLRTALRALLPHTTLGALQGD
jgi:hypothetical protein